MVEVAGAFVAGAASSVWSRVLDSADLFNGTFGSIVAVTGDAHQAAIAQDIFRQEVRIERSLRVREDIRDAHQLMIENVQTQLLMGNLVMGMCFTVLINGKPSDPKNAPAVLQELWSVCAIWSITMTLISVCFALQYQVEVSVQAKRRLLEKHRITAPNDEVVGRMGGLSLVDKVAHTHERCLREFTHILESRLGLQGAKEYIGEMYESLPDRYEVCGPFGPFCATCRPCRPLALRDAQDTVVARQDQYSKMSTKTKSKLSLQSPPGPDMTLKDGLAPEVDVYFGKSDGKTRRSPSTFERQTVPKVPGAFRCVRAFRGTRAWLSEDIEQLAEPYIVDLPDFLEGGTLVRLNWYQLAPPERRSIRLQVRGTATLYVAAQWPPLGAHEAFRGQGPPPPWSDEEMPVLHGHNKKHGFQRIEGYSILVSQGAYDLPLYRAALEEPDANGWRNVKLEFKFEGEFEAPVIIVRRGCITTSEEDWPVREFMNELDEIQPLRDDSMSYMAGGLLNMILGGFFGTWARIATDGPWPQSWRQIAFLAMAFAPALMVTISSMTWAKRWFGQDARLLVARVASHKKAKDSKAKTRGFVSEEEHEPVTYRKSQTLMSADTEDIAPHLPAEAEIQSRKSAEANVRSMVGICCAAPLGVADPVEERGEIRVDVVPAERYPLPAHMTQPTSATRYTSDNDGIQEEMSGEMAASPSRRTTSGNRRWLPTLVPKASACLQKMALRQRRIVVFKALVWAIWWATILSIVIFRVREMFGGAEGAEDSGDARMAANAPFGAEWSVTQVVWPSPFFFPAAAAVGADGRLWLAAEWSVAVLDAANFAAATPRAVAGVARLPSAARGLLVGSGDAAFGASLLVVGDESIRAMDVDSCVAPGAGVSGHAIANAPLLLATGGDSDALPLPTGVLGRMKVVAVGILPDHGGAVLAAMAPEGGGLFLSATAFGRNNSLDVAERLPWRAEVSVRALFLNTGRSVAVGGEPALWVADGQGCLRATGLNTGRVLVALRWAEPGAAASAPVALAGNATHVFLVAPLAGGGKQVVLSALIEVLMTQTARSTASCAGTI